MNLEYASRIARQVVAASRWLYVPAAFAFLIFAIWHSKEIFVTVVNQAEPWLLLITLLVWTSLHLLTPVFSWLALRDSDPRISYQSLLRIHVGRLPARYLPGGIWHTVSRVVDLHAFGVGRPLLSQMVLLENILPLSVAVSLGGLFLILAKNTHWLAKGAIVGGILIGAAGFLLLRRLGGSTRQTLRLVSYMQMASVACTFWVIASTAFYCYWSAFPAARGVASGLEVYGIYLVSWAAGFVSVFAPQGIGVFESVAGVLLKSALTFGGAVVLVAGFRVVVLVADLLAYGLLLILRVNHCRLRRER